MLNYCISLSVIFSSCCIFAAKTLNVKNDLGHTSYLTEEEGTLDLTEKGPNILNEAAIMRQQRSLFNKFGFFSGYKVGSSLPSQSSGQIIATHSSNFLGKFMNANIRLVYGSQPVIAGVIPTITPVTGPLKADASASGVGSERLTPGFILFTTRKAVTSNAAKNYNNQTDENISVVESILLPIYERVGTLKLQEGVAENRSVISTTEKHSKDTPANSEVLSQNIETSSEK